MYHKSERTRKTNRLEELFVNLCLLLGGIYKLSRIICILIRTANKNSTFTGFAFNFILHFVAFLFPFFITCQSGDRYLRIL